MHTILWLFFSAVLVPASALAQDTVRFLATADCQYENGNSARRDASHHTFDTMVAMLTDQPDVRGVLIAGDLTQNTRSDELNDYRAGIEAMSPFVYEGLGNHDVAEPNFSQRFACFFRLPSCVTPAALRSQVSDKERASPLTRKESPHYSWDWDDVHFVQLNVFPANAPAPQFPAIDPRRSLDFLVRDLAGEVGASGRPVVLVHHYGFDPFSRGATGEEWWTEAQRRAYWEVLVPYNVVLIVSGHLHPEPSGTWWMPWSRPDGFTDGPAGIPSVVAGAALNGAFVDVTLAGTNLRVDRRAGDGRLIGRREVAVQRAPF